jgi:hypothetical protein
MYRVGAADMQRIDHASAAALKRGETLHVTYKDGFTHRLILEEPLPAMPTEWQKLAFHHMMRHPVDVYPACSLADAEKLLAWQAKLHGEWTLQRQPWTTSRQA